MQPHGSRGRPRDAGIGGIPRVTLCLLPGTFGAAQAQDRPPARPPAFGFAPPDFPRLFGANGRVSPLRAFQIMFCIIT